MKERLDVLLVERGLFPSREKAKLSIMEGNVYVEGQKEDKAGTLFDKEAKIEVRGKSLQYVSRGGLKLEKAMAEFPIELQGKICMDIGASTGGFTDCMLQNGAEKVYAIDVGYGQLAYKLRTDARVVCMEKTNFRYVKAENLKEGTPSFASVDVSFISLSLILPVAYELLDEKSEVVALIKPQFEAGKEKVGKKGVVREPAVHEEVILKVLAMAEETGFGVCGLTFSPIRGPEGNIEYLLYLRKGAEEENAETNESVSEEFVKAVVKKSHEETKG